MASHPQCQPLHQRFLLFTLRDYFTPFFKYMSKFEASYGEIYIKTKDSPKVSKRRMHVFKLLPRRRQVPRTLAPNEIVLTDTTSPRHARSET